MFLRSGPCELLLPCDHPLAGYEAIVPDALSGCSIAVFPRERNPAAWDETAGRLAEAGACLETSPETLRDALVALARRKHIPVLLVSSFGDQPVDLTGLCLRALADPRIRADFHLIRRRGRPGDKTLDRFWRFAHARAEGAAAQCR